LPKGTFSKFIEDGYNEDGDDPDSMDKVPHSDIDLENINDLQYTGVVSFGTPNQRVEVMFDTGSALVWTYDLERCNLAASGMSCPSGDKYS
jgi:hypothetical protein